MYCPHIPVHSRTLAYSIQQVFQTIVLLQHPIRNLKIIFVYFEFAMVSHADLLPLFSKSYTFSASDPAELNWLVNESNPPSFAVCAIQVLYIARVKLCNNCKIVCLPGKGLSAVIPILSFLLNFRLPNFFTFSQNFTWKAQSTPINQYELFNLPLRRRWSNGDSETEFVAAVLHEFELGGSGAYRLLPDNLFVDDWDSTSTA